MYYIDITNYLSIKITMIYKHMLIYTITLIYLIYFDEGQNQKMIPIHYLLAILHDVSLSMARCFLICGKMFIDLWWDIY